MTSNEILGKIPKELFSWIKDAMNHIHHHIYKVVCHFISSIVVTYISILLLLVTKLR